MMRDLTPGARATLLLLAACALFAAIATTGTTDDPYAPNEWVFSHIHLAHVALERGEIPLNWHLLTGNGNTDAAFQHATGLERMTLYASTLRHFWNGMPLHPSLVATLSLLTGLPPETVVRIPVGGLLTVALVSASATLLLSRVQGVDPRLATAAPFLAAIASAPLALDMRVLMPSITLTAVLLFLHLMLRRTLLTDRAALPLALAPLLLLPFWYYTMAYFFILLFTGFLAAGLLDRWVRPAHERGPAPIPTAIAVGVPCFLAVALLANGVLTSQLHLARLFTPPSRVTPGIPADYTSFLNRETWRSLLLYTEGALLFAPLAGLSLVGALRTLRRRPMGPARTLFTAWTLGGALFSALMLLTVGVSFLNRTAIYLAPVAILAATYLLARHWHRATTRRALAAGLALTLTATPLLVATAAPHYGVADREAFEWMGAHVPREAAVYASLEAASVLFRAHGYRNVTTSEPTTPLLQGFWYSDNPRNVAPYLSASDYLLLRDDARTHGFEEFGPVRSPISESAYAKFLRVPDLHLVYDNGEVQLFRVQVTPEKGHLAP